MKESEKALYKGSKNQLHIIGRLDSIPEKKFFSGPMKIELVTLSPIENPETGVIEDHLETHTVVIKNGLVDFFFQHAKEGVMFSVQGPIQTKISEESDGRITQTIELMAEVFELYEGPNHE